MAIGMRWRGLRAWRWGGNGRFAGDRLRDALEVAATTPAVAAPGRPAAPEPPAGGFRLEGRRLGVLLVHGLASTPQAMQPLGMALARHGLDVEGILLPGHGTRPEDLVVVTWNEWYETVRDAVRAMRPRYDRIFVCGQSLGGSLALHVAAEEPVDGVITLAGVAYMRDWRLMFLPLLARFSPWRRSAGNDIAKPGGSDVGSYDRMPMSAIRELLYLGQQVRADLPHLRVPALVIQSVVDHVVHPGNADYIHDHLGSRTKEIVRLQRSYHVISLDNDFDLVVDRIVRFVRKVGCAQVGA